MLEEKRGQWADDDDDAGTAEHIEPDEHANSHEPDEPNATTNGSALDVGY